MQPEALAERHVRRFQRRQADDLGPCGGDMRVAMGAGTGRSARYVAPIRVVCSSSTCQTAGWDAAVMGLCQVARAAREGPRRPATSRRGLS